MRGSVRNGFLEDAGLLLLRKNNNLLRELDASVQMVLTFVLVKVTERMIHGKPCSVIADGDIIGPLQNDFK